MSSLSLTKVVAHGHSSVLKKSIRNGFWNENRVSVDGCFILVDKNIHEYHGGSNVRCRIEVDDSGNVTATSLGMEEFTDVVIEEFNSIINNSDKTTFLFTYAGEDDPVRRLDDAIKYFLQIYPAKSYREFVDMNMDNPWVRVIVIEK